MSNNQDFVVETGIEVAGSLNYSQGTITSGVIDLSSGGLFKDTLSSNTTYSFINPRSFQVVQVELTVTNNAIITWPNTIEWLWDSSTPNPPHNDHTKIYQFIVLDSGSRILGGYSYDER